VVAFGHHKDTIKEIRAAFGATCVRLIGDTLPRQRQEAVDRFQNEESVRLFLGSKAAAEGTTLTASCHVVLFEMFWTGVVEQMEDRCHRIGSERWPHILVQHLVLRDSTDALMAKAVVRKQSILSAALD